MKKARKQVTTGTPKQSGTPCAMVLRLIPRSPRSAGLVSLRRLPELPPASLIPASGDQDHTALPSVPVSPAWRDPHVHRILLQRLWRLAKRPSRPKQDARIEPYISEKRKTNIFAVRAGHVGQISDPGRYRQPACAAFLVMNADTFRSYLREGCPCGRLGTTSLAHAHFAPSIPLCGAYINRITDRPSGVGG
jgi:hypothetical protein